MLTVLLEEAREGMTLAAPVTHPDRPDQVLLNQGYVLESKILSRLSDMGIELVFVNYPGLEDLDRHLAPMLSPARRKIYTQVKRVIESCQQRTSPAIPYGDYYTATRDMIVTLMDGGQHPIFMDQMARLGDDAVGHATAVAHLSLLLGLKLEAYLIEQRKRLAPRHAKEVVNVGVAGMLHDLGKTRLPEELRKYHGCMVPEDPKQEQAWMEHTRLGYEMIHDGVEPSAASAVLCHHQRYDGQGLGFGSDADDGRPRGGERIHVFARILFAANLYDRLGMNPLGKGRRSNLEIYHLMRTRHAGWMDPVVCRMLEAVAPPFPPGVKVELSDGRGAVVCRVESADPYRPAVKCFGEDGRTLDESAIELRKETDLRITGIGGRPVEGMMPSDAEAARAA